MSNFMMNMISWVLLLLVILTLYLIDKVNHLAKLYEPPKPEPVPEPEAPPAGDVLFAGLEGKKLWDAMNGKAVQGFDSTLLDSLRPHYEPILREHICATFKDGVDEAQETEAKTPSSQRQIDTVRGHIQSWLPPQHLGSIYRAGVEFGGAYAKAPNPDTLNRLKETIDSVTSMLYQRAGVPLDVPYSELLLAPPEPPEDAQAASDVLALTDQTDQAEVLEGMPDLAAQELAQGLEHAQAYEEQQRQDLAAAADAEVVEAHEPQPELKPA
jgi:hypothetical protein